MSNQARKTAQDELLLVKTEKLPRRDVEPTPSKMFFNWI